MPLPPLTKDLDSVYARFLKGLPTDIDFESGLCRQTDPDLFFPSPGEAVKVRQAKAVCAQCPLLADCRDYIMETERGWYLSLRHGIWGGMTPLERLRMDAGAAA